MTSLNYVGAWQKGTPMPGIWVLGYWEKGHPGYCICRWDEEQLLFILDDGDMPLDDPAYWSYILPPKKEDSPLR